MILAQRFNFVLLLPTSQQLKLLNNLILGSGGHELKIDVDFKRPKDYLALMLLKGTLTRV